MKKKIPFKVLIPIWIVLLFYIPALQYAAPDIPMFIYYGNFLILDFVSTFILGLSFYLNRRKQSKMIFAKLSSYTSLLLVFVLLYLPARYFMPFQYQDSTSMSFLLNHFFFLIFMIGICFGFEFFFFILDRWDNLRKRSITLSLTQTISLIVLVIPSTIMVASLLITVLATRPDPSYSYTAPVTYLGKFFVTIATQVTPFTGISMGTGIVAVIVAAPFVFLFSWLIANFYTKRLKRLVQSVNELKNGNLSERVEIHGEDEISRLMQDFNEMSASLETSQNELLQKQDKISALMASQKEWLLKISHELRTPITTLKAVLESSPASTTKEINQQNSVLQQEVDGLHHLIEDLFTLTQSEHMQLSLDLQPLQIPQQLVPILKPLQQFAWEKKQIEFVFNANKSSISISVDHFRLAQVLRNLTHNAVRHTDAGGVIRLEVETDHDQVILQFKDTGEGISEDMVDKIWQPFQKHPRSDGSGIGLSLSKELIRSMGGNISVSSQAGCGACFIIQFPIN
ncbi:MAG: HAMP domain-containing histidine kinase [Anaerolineaceae bacterium]|nr:HAMP domain-containing histidine kinase [Anaerolineaceae bacterium]